MHEIALWATIGLLLNAVGYTVGEWQFWCFLSTYWAVSYISRQAGRVEGMIDFMELDNDEQQRLKQALKRIKGEEL